MTYCKEKTRIVSEAEFSDKIKAALKDSIYDDVDCVLGPGRSGAVAAVYASHILSVPFFPYGTKIPDEFSRLLVIDTAELTGKTLRKCAKKYEEKCFQAIAIFKEPPLVAFWYEAPKPQRYKKDRPL